MANVSLTAGVRANLLALQSTADLLSQTQARLGSGKKVGSAMDNASAYFTAQALSNRSSDLTNRLDGINTAISTVNAANAGITGISSLLDQLKGIAQDALSNAVGSSNRSADAVKFNTLRTQVDQLAKDSGFNGVNLLANQSLTVQFAEKIGSSTIALTGFTADTSAGGLNVAAAVTATWKSATTATASTALNAAVTAIESAQSTLRSQAASMSANLGVLTARQTFIKSMVNTLQTGSDNLTNADLNTESANMLALNTQQQLGISALSLASQASQSVLKLLG